MPLIATRNYLSKIDEFAAHWTLVNATLGASPLLLQGGYALANLSTDRTALAAQLAAVEQAGNNAQAASADRDIRRAAVRERLRQFSQTVRGLLPNTVYPAMLPHLPGPSAAPGLWNRAMEDAAHVWNRINTDAPPPVGFTPPLVLTGAYTRALFVADVTALNAAFTASGTTRLNAESARSLRDQLFKPIQARIVQYRAVVQGRFPAGHSLISSLPALTPARGSTPAAVNLSGAWDTGMNQAILTYTISKDPNLESYQLRAGGSGTRYDTESEQVVATNAPNVLFFLTDTGLVASGSVVWFKVYVLTTTGNEKGSRAVKVVRP